MKPGNFPLKIHINLHQTNRCRDLSQTGYTDSVCLRLREPVATSQEGPELEAKQTASAALSDTNFKGGVSETVTRLSHTSAQVSLLMQSFCHVKQLKERAISKLISKVKQQKEPLWELPKIQICCRRLTLAQPLLVTVTSAY